MALKLFPPDPPVEVYNEGFGSSDLLGRKVVGEKLSRLIDNVEDPIVIAVDGAWGTGKTHFLKRWVGAHTIENGGKALTVYFDAFHSDYLDDPLIAITSAIGTRVASKSKSVWKKMKGAAFKLARPATRVGLAVVTHGATELAAAAADVAVEAAGKEMEKAADEFWKKEDGRRAAMEQLKSTLISLTHGEDGPRPLVVVVDELDRCRPDYALGILEVIKHFFTVPYVQFVLGVNMVALQDSARARYGVDFAAEEYLRRFISLSIRLPENIQRGETTSVGLVYFDHVAKEMGINDAFKEILQRHLKLVMGKTPLSIRDFGRLLSHAALLLASSTVTNTIWGWQELTAAMTLMKAIRPELYSKAVSGRLTMADIDGFYGISTSVTDGAERDAYSHEAAIVRGMWELVITGDVVSNDKEEFYRGFDNYGGRGRAQKAPGIIARDFLDIPTFSSTS
jgi:hypothetical protein